MPMGIFIGFGSGLASAVLFYSASRGGVLVQLLLLILTPLPVMIAGLGFGWAAALAGGIAGALIMTLTLSGGLGAIFFLAIGLPAIVTAWLADLGRSSPNSQTISWYPAGSILAALSLIGGAVPVVIAIINGGSFANLRPRLLIFIAEFSKEMTKQMQVPPMTEAAQAALADTMLTVIPGVFAAYWMILMAINLYLAGRVAHASGLLTRPWPNLHQLQPPPWLLLVLAGSLALWMAAGFPRLVGIAFVGAIWIALALLGLSVLHAISAGRVPWMLWLTYAGLLNPAGPYALGLLGLIGLLEPFLNLRGRFAKPALKPND